MLKRLASVVRELRRARHSHSAAAAVHHSKAEAGAVVDTVFGQRNVGCDGSLSYFFDSVCVAREASLPSAFLGNPHAAMSTTQGKGLESQAALIPLSRWPVVSIR